MFSNLERNKINRLFNIFIPVDACFCGLSLEYACQIIIIFQVIEAISNVFLSIKFIFKLFLQVIYFFSICQILIEIGLIILIYNGY